MRFGFNPFTQNLDITDISGTGAAPIDTLTGNTGGAVSPDGSGNVNIVGSGVITVTGSPGTNTLTISTSGGGTVTNVSGTTNRITVTSPTTTPVIDIAATYVGQSSITTLGTITTGVWNGTAVDATHGGTGQTTYASGDILYASAANTLSKLPKGSDTQVLTLAAGIPSWASPTTGTVTSVSGTANRITSTGGNTPVIDISASYVGQSSITTLGTITTGVWTGTNIALANGGTNASLTASNGGIFYSTASAGAILAGTATANQMLQSGASTTPAWSTATWPATTTINQLLYSASANTVSGLTVANTSLLRTSASGVISWGSNLAGDFTYTTGTAGATRTLTVNNTDNANTASNANLTIAQGGTSGGYAGLTITKGSTRSYAIGLANSTSETLVIQTNNAAAVTPGSGTNVWSMTNAGARNMPLQPCFAAALTSVISNVTGDGTNYTVLFDTASINIGSGYATGTGLYTAPVTGRYLINFSILGTTSSSYTSFGVFIYVNSTPTYHYNAVLDAGSVIDASCTASQIISLTASDTVSIHINSNTVAASKNVSLTGASNGFFSNFSGYLVS